MKIAIKRYIFIKLVVAKKNITRFIDYMNIKISAVNYEKCYPSRLKKFFQSDLNYKTSSHIVINSKRAIVGNLPSEIIKLFSEKNKGSEIKDFQNALGEIANYLRNSFRRLRVSKPGFENFKNLYSSELSEFENHSSMLLNRRVENLLPKGYRFQIRYADRGAFKNVFRLSLYDDKYQKAMHDKAWQIYFSPDCKYDKLAYKHNNYAEANFWTFIKNIIGHRMDKSQFTKHYISDMKNAYSITEFADNTITPTTSVFPLGEMGIYGCDANEFNRPKNGKLFDGGGYEKMENFIEDKIIRRYYKKLLNNNSAKDLQNRISSVKKLFENPKTPFRDKIKRAYELFHSRII